MGQVRVNINPISVRWARERARLTEEQAAGKAGVSLDTYSKWESGDLAPTMRQLFLLVQTLRQPVQMFFLSSLPAEEEVVMQLRRLPSASPGESAELVAAVNQASERRGAALALHRELGETPVGFDLVAVLKDDPEAVGQAIRTRIGVSMDEQSAWANARVALKTWRAALEEAGVLVFQVPGVKLSEMRGFCLPARPLPVIGLNSADLSYNGRIFTLFHELAHILLGEAVLDSGVRNIFGSRGGPAEIFCDRVAAATLMPKDDLGAYVLQMGLGKGLLWRDLEVQRLCRRYSVSTAVVVRRLKTLSLISRECYNELRPIYDAYRPPQRRSSGGDNYATILSRIGTLVPELAFRAYYADRWSSSDLSALFGLQAKYLGNLERKLHGAG